MQKITTQYRAFNTSQVQNDRYVGVLPSGIYQGYKLATSAGIVNLIDIITGEDNSSVLVTPEGVVVTETSDVLGAVRIQAADPNFDRIDVVVAEYQFDTDPLREQQYKVIQGANQLLANTEPIVPDLENVYQVALGYVRVTAGSNSISAADLRPEPQALWTKADSWADLRPVINESDTRSIYVYPGVFPNLEGTQALTFYGGYSSAIEDETFLDGETRYYTFGIDDSLTVVPVSWSLTKEQPLTGTTLVVARAETRKVGGRVEIVALEDIRLPFARTRYRSNDELRYQDLLANSIYRYLRVEGFDDLDAVVQSSVVGGTVTLDSGVKAARVQGTAGVEVEFSTADLIDGSAINIISEFMLAADSNVENLTFDYSVTSATGGFTGNRYYPGDIVKIGSDTASALFIKFYVPGEEFVAKSYTYIYSFGALINRDDENSNLLSISSLGITELSKSVDNLIHNGDFYYWSKNTLAGKAANLMSKDELEFPISTEAPQAADGWQFTHINGSFDSNSIKRGIGIGTRKTTALRLQFAQNPNATDTQPTTLEYRIPRGTELSGEKLTFAFDHFTSAAAAVTIGVAQLRRTDAGLITVSKDEQLVTTFSGTAHITSSSVGSEIDVISFYVKFNPNVPVSFSMWGARAAVGTFPTLPFSYVKDAALISRAYHERGQFYLATTAQASAVVGASSQFGTSKYLELGDLVTQTVPSAASDRSKNISNVSYSADRDSITVSASASSDAAFILQTDWEAFVKYTGEV